MLDPRTSVLLASRQHVLPTCVDFSHTHELVIIIIQLLYV